MTALAGSEPSLWATTAWSPATIGFAGGSEEDYNVEFALSHRSRMNLSDGTSPEPDHRYVANLAADDGFLITGVGSGSGLVVGLSEPGTSMATVWPTSSSETQETAVLFKVSSDPASRKAYIIYGKASSDGTQFGTANTDATGAMQVLDLRRCSPPTDGFILQGSTETNLDSVRVFRSAGAGDVNGDGLDDLIVGASAGRRW